MTMASFPMYDFPEVHWALDALWGAFARNLKARGVAGVPDKLTHTRPLKELWTNPDLFISQCCGLDVVKHYTRHLVPLATPLTSADGANGPRYRSKIIVHEDSNASSLEDLRGKICTVNGPDSHSGMNALRAMIAPISEGRPFFAEVRESGAHADSITMVAEGQADVAAIDCLTYALLERHRPAAVAGVRVLTHTDFGPGIPYVARTNADPETIELMREAIIEAFEDPDLGDALDALFLIGVTVLPKDEYYELIDFERRAVSLGYPKLQ
ncbi:MAG: PhnD/SsuA/transferrin family substrate-binding protein [Alphaproteobacteria bacterium]